MATYSGPSIVDYLKSTGGASDFASRTALATQKGIKNYTGTAEQNTQLLGILRAPAPAPVAPTPIAPVVPTPIAPTATPTPYAGGLAPDAPATATGQANPAYVDPQQSIIQANLAEQNRLTAEANASQSQDYSIIKSTLGNTVDESNASKITKAILASYEANSKAPAKATLTDTLTSKRAELGVGTQETALATVDQKLAQLEADYMSSTASEQDRQVSMTQIGKRESQIGKQYTAAKNNLLVEKNAVVNQLNQKYAVLDTFMKYAGVDMANAQQDYNTKFSQAISMANLVSGAENTQTDNARANATLILNTLKDKKVDWNTLDATAQADMTNLELQSGFPRGTMQFILSSVNAPIVSLGAEFTDPQNNRQLPVITKDTKTGVSVSLVNIGPAKATGGSTTVADVTKADLQAGRAKLDASKNIGPEADGKYADPNLYKQMHDIWTSKGGTTASFIKEYPPAQYVNPANTFLPSALMPKGSTGGTTTSTSKARF